MSDQTREISAFWARRIRWGLKAGQTPAWWPVYIVLSPTRRAFNHSFRREGLYRNEIRWRR